MQSIAAPLLKAPPTFTKSFQKGGDGRSQEVIDRAAPSKETLGLVGKVRLPPNLNDGTKKMAVRGCYSSLSSVLQLVHYGNTEQVASATFCPFYS